MSQPVSRVCPDCAEDVPTTTVDRRDFIRVVSGGAAGLVGGMSLLSSLSAKAAPEAKADKKPGEDLVREFYGTLTAEQKAAIVMPWDHGADKGAPTRLSTFNGPPAKLRIGQLDKKQQELALMTLKAILSGEDAYERLTRGGKWDNAGSFAGNGIAIFGDPTSKENFSWVFAGHHLTLRCDGNSQPNAAFGGPMYYGHSANGHSEANVYNYQTKQAMSVFDMLNPAQQAKAIVVGSAGDGQGAYKFREAGKDRPGVAYADLDASQKALVAGVMRTLLDPFRKEDGDEVMELVKKNGGMEKIHIAFYKDSKDKGNDRWDSWRLEGPGFVWNLRVLPHVHCFVNIAIPA